MTTFTTFMAMATALLATRSGTYTSQGGATGSISKYITNTNFTTSYFYPQSNRDVEDYNYIYFNDGNDYVDPANADYGGEIRDYIVLDPVTYYSCDINYHFNLPNNQHISFEVSRNGQNYAPRFRSVDLPTLTELYNVEIIFDFTGFYLYDDLDAYGNIVVKDYQTWHFTFSLFDYNDEILPFEQILSGVNDYPDEQYYYDYYYLVCSCYIRNVDLSDYKDYVEGIAFDEGYDDGYNQGKDDGFNLGAGSGNSFKQLFAVLVDTPIVFFRKLFGYELFGINLFAALTTIVSLIVALSIFRLVKGIF